MWPHSRKVYSAGETDPWPALSRISEFEITPDASPVDSIESAARLLGESDTPAEMRQELVSIIIKECKHLSASITGLLQQRREATPPQACEADITLIIDSAVREAEFVLSGRGITLRKEIAPDVPPIQCNPDQIRNLFVSLIINAAQSATSGTELILDAHCGYNGVGLDVRGQKPFVRWVANRFFGSRSVTPGVGLAAAHDIVRWHGGRISRKANLRKGPEFSVWLPVRRNDTYGGWQGADSRGR
jgi:signal transduction histidine kinase